MKVYKLRFEFYSFAASENVEVCITAVNMFQMKRAFLTNTKEISARHTREISKEQRFLWSEVKDTVSYENLKFPLIS